MLLREVLYENRVSNCEKIKSFQFTIYSIGLHELELSTLLYDDLLLQFQTDLYIIYVFRNYEFYSYQGFPSHGCFFLRQIGRCIGLPKGIVSFRQLLPPPQHSGYYFLTRFVIQLCPSLHFRIIQRISCCSYHTYKSSVLHTIITSTIIVIFILIDVVTHTQQ